MVTACHQLLLLLKGHFQLPLKGHFQLLLKGSSQLPIKGYFLPRVQRFDGDLVKSMIVELNWQLSLIAVIGSANES